MQQNKKDKHQQGDSLVRHYILLYILYVLYIFVCVSDCNHYGHLSFCLFVHMFIKVLGHDKNKNSLNASF